MFKPATLKNAYQDNVELEIHLSRKMYGRVLSPDRELSVDSAGVFSWKFWKKEYCLGLGGWSCKLEGPPTEERFVL